MNAFREILSKSLEIMDDGKFQDFCLKFLPLYNRAYEGLIRFGHTPGGKTRRGTPDLLKTTESGDQIAVQCSTEDVYWTPPKDKQKYSTSWKPCSDIDKCITNVNNLTEIILCSNKEIPTNQPNSKSEIIGYAKVRTASKVSLLSLADIDDFLASKIESPEVQELLREFFLEIFQFIQTGKEAEKNLLAIEILRERPLLNIDSVMDLLGKVLGQTANIEAAKNTILERLDEIESRYQVRFSKNFDGVSRTIAAQPPLSDVFGKIILITGVPKAGKTYLLRQLVANWVQRGYRVKWFNAETALTNEEGEFLSEIIKTMLSEVLPKQLAKAIAYGQKAVDEIDSAQFHNLGTKTIFILDNANRLSPASLRRLSDILSRLKKKSIANLALVLTSNRDLRLSIPSIDHVLTISRWDEKELSQLLDYTGINYKQEQVEQYLELLQLKSGGHPALAIALARKYPTFTEIFQTIFSAQSVEDEDLTNEVKSVLYQDLLINSDYQNFVQRLSALSYPADSRVVDAICEKVTPPIATSPNVMLQHLGQCIIEGDENNGFYVAHVFKEVAKQQITQAQQVEVLKQAATTLLTPRGKVFSVDDVTTGIFYALASSEIETALFWSVMLLHNLLPKSLEPDQLRYVVNRIELVTFLKVPDNPRFYLLFGAVVLFLAQAYSRLKDHKQALVVLSRLDTGKTPVADGPLANGIALIQTAIDFYRITELCFAREYKLAADELISVDFDKMGNFLPDKQPLVDLHTLGTQLIKFIPPKDIPKPLINKLLASTDLNNDAMLASLIQSATKIGMDALRSGAPIETITDLFAEEPPLLRLLRLAAVAAYDLEKKDFQSAISKLEEAETLIAKENIIGPLVRGHFLQQKADAEYLANDLSAAKAHYEAHLSLISDALAFDYGWAQYRAGLTEEDPRLAQERFEKASRVFSHLGLFDLFSRCEGERGIASFQLGQPREFVQIIEKIIIEYYEKGNREFGTPSVIALAQANRLLLQLEGKSMPDLADAQLPGLEGVSASEFQRLLSFSELKRRSYQVGATGATTPRGGILIAAYLLAMLYEKLAVKTEKLNILNRAFRGRIENPFDKESLPVIAKFYLDELYDTDDFDEILRITKLILDCQLADIKAKTPSFLSHCMFQKSDVLMSVSKPEWLSEYAQLLMRIEEYCKEGEFPKLDFWLAAIYYRKSMLSVVRKAEKEEKIALWKRTYAYAIRGNNSEAIIYSAQALAFEFAESAISLRQLAELSFNFLKAVEDSTILDRLGLLGRNLFTLWSDMDFRRLSEYDLKVKKTLLDGAKSLKSAGFDRHTAGPVMVLLLASIYDHDGPAIKWALDQLRQLGEKIPDDVLEKLRDYLKES